MVFFLVFAATQIAIQVNEERAQYETFLHELDARNEIDVPHDLV